jgi:hypothetical protein
MNSSTLFYVIYWEKTRSEYGFVSYNNRFQDIKEEYNPVSFDNATKYLYQKDAERTINWYKSRGGFGYFILMHCWVTLPKMDSTIKGVVP